MSDAAAARKANLFQISGDGIQVTYSTSGFDGKPKFGYQDSHLSKAFSGDEIRTVETEIGTLVTVTTLLTVDAGSTTFTLLIPAVNLGVANSANISLTGITTVHKFLIAGPPQGQDEFYTVHPMTGTAAFVVF